MPNVWIMINLDVHAKNWLTKVNVTMDLLRIFPSINEYECDQSRNTEQYIDCANCKYTKKLTDKLVEEFSKDISGGEMINNVRLNYSGKVFKSFTKYTALLITIFIVIIGISSASYYTIFPVEYINLVAAYFEMLHYN